MHMNNNWIKIYFLLFSFVCFAQQDVVTNGGDAKSEGGSFSYSVGQILVSQIDPPSSSWSNEAITINHGVQQFFIPNCENNQQVKITAFPNPSNGLVNIELSNWDDVEISLSVFDVLGKSVLNKKIYQKSTQLNLTQFNTGIYLISVDNVCGSVSTFKLILNN